MFACKLNHKLTDFDTFQSRFAFKKCHCHYMLICRLNCTLFTSMQTKQTLCRTMCKDGNGGAPINSFEYSSFQNYFLKWQLCRTREKLSISNEKLVRLPEIKFSAEVLFYAKTLGLRECVQRENRKQHELILGWSFNISGNMSVDSNVSTDFEVRTFHTRWVTIVSQSMYQNNRNMYPFVDGIKLSN